MSKEKIAFLYPFHKSGDDDKSPMLLLAVEQIPVCTDLNFQVHFLGLSHDQEYWVCASISREENDLEVKLSGDKGVWIRAKGYPDSKDTLATSLSMRFDNCKIDALGDYIIRVSISKNGSVVHESHAYFSVSDLKDA